MTYEQWTEFLEKLDFALLTKRWNMLPLHWLEGDLPEDLNDLDAQLFSSLMELRSDSPDDESLSQICKSYRKSLAQEAINMDPDLCPPGCRVELRYLDPCDLGEGDCLVTVGSWDRLGHAIAEASGSEQSFNNPSESPLRLEPGNLNFRHILLFPERGTPSPRAFRHLCEKTLRQARVLGARRMTITHLHLPQPGLPDRFAAAELVSAVRQMMRDNQSGVGLTVSLQPYSRRNFDDYVHWFSSLKQLYSPSLDEATYIQAEKPAAEAHEPWNPGEAFRALAERTSGLAQEAGSQLGKWLTTAAPQPRSRTPRASFQQLRALNFVYLRRWQDAQDCLRFDSPSTSAEITSYIKAMIAVLQHEEEDFPEPEAAASLRNGILDQSESLAPEDHLAAYLRLAAFRLNLHLEGPESLVTQRNVLLQEAQARADFPLLNFLESLGEDDAGEWKNSEKLQYIPVYPSRTKAAPDQSKQQQEDSHE